MQNRKILLGLERHWSFGLLRSVGTLSQLNGALFLVRFVL
jgi:hypothetical protein